ncbi:MAG: hypothetical protein HQL52_09770 [Magnetococcales bacterium]|nr:hypothetical protein [Magnetococcales bacterium]
MSSNHDHDEPVDKNPLDDDPLDDDLFRCPECGSLHVVGWGEENYDCYDCGAVRSTPGAFPHDPSKGDQAVSEVEASPPDQQEPPSPSAEQGDPRIDTATLIQLFGFLGTLLLIYSLTLKDILSVPLRIGLAAGYVVGIIVAGSSKDGLTEEKLFSITTFVLTGIGALAGVGWGYFFG